MSLVTIPADVIDRLVAHARDEAPRECCGLLLGAADRIVDIVSTRNIAVGEGRYLIEPADHIGGRRHARHRGLEVVGFYHSHPQSAAEPSERDRAEASYPDHLYLIVSLRADEPDMRLYRLSGGNFHEVALVRVA